MSEQGAEIDKEYYDRLRVGEAHSNNAEYYVEQRDDAPDIHYCCFGTTTFVRLEDHVGAGGGILSTYHLWQRERDGRTIELVGKDDTVWKEVEERRRDDAE